MTQATADLLQEAIALQRQGDLAGAALRYGEILRVDPQNADALFGLGQTLCQQGDLQGGIEVVQRALAGEPRRGRLHNLLGMALAALGRTQEAIASFDQAIACEPTLAGPHANRGDALLGLGRAAEAVESYDRSLALRPSSIETLCNRGVALQGLGRHEEALASYRSVIDLDPSFAEVHINSGNAHAQLGRYEEALACYEKALTIREDLAEALGGRGLALSRLGRHAEAITSFDRATAVDPARIDVQMGRADALIALGRYQDALASFDAVVAQDPGHADAWVGRGFVLNLLDRPADALAACDRSLAIEADHVEALSNRATALCALERYEEALASYDRALGLSPDHLEIRYNRGCALAALDRHEEALAVFAGVLSSDPGHYGSLSNRGKVLASLGRHREALEAYEGILARRPDDVETLYNRGTVLMSLDRLHEALSTYDRVLAIAPDHVRTLDNRGNVLLELGRYREAQESYRRAIAIAPNPACHTNLIFALNFDPELTAVELQAERARWNEIHARPLASEIRPHANRRDPDRRLRIGYMSGHFRYQAATYSFAQVILGHDPARFEVVCYSDTRNEDALTERLRGRADTWHRIVGWSDARVAELIRRDGIDVLVDTVGHMSGNRLLVFARKPSPVQVCAWGEPTGTGLTTMDYVLSDPVHAAPGERHLMSEQVFDLPNFLGYWTPEPLPEPGPLPARSRGFVTFGSFNRFIKIQLPVLRCWAAILRGLPTARLVLKVDQPLADTTRRASIDAVLDQEGIDRQRVELRGRTDRIGHFNAYREIDIALDPFPHGGAMSTLDALWMGVPVVTWPGRIISSRLAAASLTALGLTDFIASDPERYVDLALAKARDLDALAQLRQGLRSRMASSVIGDAARYTAAVEGAYREMWRRWCAKA